jgi:succinate dehydrogenase / fumarate reductase flavoprotein subunit
MEATWRRVNLVCSYDGAEVALTPRPLARMRAELVALFERAELAKYMTEDELVEFDAHELEAEEGD